MDNLRQLLVAIAALTLLFSAVSSASPNYFVGSNAFADDGVDNGDENTGSSTDEQRDDSDQNEQDEHSVEATFGSHSKVKLGIDNETDDNNAGLVEADLVVGTEGGDLADGEHAVSLRCGTPVLDKTLDGSLVVEHGIGDFESSVGLVNGTTYQGCHLDIGDIVVNLPEFTVLAVAAEQDGNEDDGQGNDDHGSGGAQPQNGEDNKDNNNQQGDYEHGEGGYERNAQLENSDHGIKIELKTNTTLDDGTYSVHFTCASPALDLTFENTFKVQAGQGEFGQEIDLAAGNYEQCKVAVGEEVLSTYDSFTVGANEDSDDVKEKRMEKRREMVASTNSEEEHRRRLDAHPASTGNYDPGWNYTLTASGTGTPDINNDEDLLGSLDTAGTNSSSLEAIRNSTVDVNIDMGVWKSNRALVLLSVLGGTIEVGGETYNVDLGYALYSTSHNAMRIGAFVSDVDGNVYMLKLRGSAVDEYAAFPMASGESVDMVFEGNSGPARNSFSHWDLDLEGTVKAG